MGKTAIGWTDFSVNPIRARNLETGDVGHFCEKVSPGCAHCYSANWNVAQRHKRKDGAEAVTGTGLDFLPVNRSKVELFLHEETLREPLKRRKPTKWFWCDMTDLFGEFIRREWIDRCLAVMLLSEQHIHQVLTKRIDRASVYLNDPETVWRIWKQADAIRPGIICPAGLPHMTNWWPIPNLWLGTSVEDKPRADERIQHLLRCPAAVRFLSCEPLLGPVDLMNIEWATSIRTARGEAVYGSMSCLHGLVACDEHDRIAPVDWVIVGDESGPKRRRSPEGAAAEIVADCQTAGVAVYVKQLNIGGKVTTDMSLFPDHLRYQDFPVPGVEQRRIEW